MIEPRVVYVDVASAEGAALAEDAWTQMSPDEVVRHDRLVFARDRLRFRVTRGLVRRLLAGATGRTPQSLRFERPVHGKPTLVDPQGLDFSVAHAAGWVGCVVAAEADVGLDLEPLGGTPGVDVEAVAARYFSRREAADLFSLPPARRTQRFVRSWTLKEAYVKACGLGLAIPLGEVDFLLDDEDALVALLPSLEVPDPNAWSFAPSRVGPGHFAALAVHSRVGVG